MIILDLHKSFADLREIPISNFISEIKFVPLEDNAQALIGDLNVTYEVIDDFIIVKQSISGKHQLLLFDRNTGQFIMVIGKQGKAPGEFERWSNIPYNELKRELYALNYSHDIIVFNTLGANTGIIKTPYLPDPKMVTPKSNPELFSKSFLQFYEMLESNIVVGYYQNFSGWENKKLILFTNEGVLKIFPNYLTWDRNQGGGFMLPPGGFAKFYRWADKTYFLEIFCDTLYEVTKERLIPRYYFDAGPYKAEYSKQVEVAPKYYNYFLIAKVNENNKYIFFTFSFNKRRYIGFVEKRNNGITICNEYFSDDISKLMYIVPDHFTKNNEMIYIIRPAELIKWFKQNPEKEAVARSRFPWLRNISEFSNPIIAIGKCND